jgi:hypothetical protein
MNVNTFSNYLCRGSIEFTGNRQYCWSHLIEIKFYRKFENRLVVPIIISFIFCAIINNWLFIRAGPITTLREQIW